MMMVLYPDYFQARSQSSHSRSIIPIFFIPLVEFITLSLKDIHEFNFHRLVGNTELSLTMLAVEES